MKKLILLLLLVLCSSCYSPQQKRTYFFNPLLDTEGEWVLPLHTETRLVFVSEKNSTSLFSQTEASLHHYHRLLDAYHHYTENQKTLINLAAINEHYGKEGKLFLEKELATILRESFSLAKLTRGYFNPSIGSLSKLWKKAFSQQKDPSDSQIKEALSCVVKAEDLASVFEINLQENSLQIHPYPSCRGKVILDLGAMAKGAISDLLYPSLEKANHSFLWDAGSSSIRAYHPQKTPWTIGLKNPKKEDLFLSFSCENCALSTSADNEHFFFNPHHIRRHHILNPHTGYPENHYRSITLLAEKNAGVLDAISTAFFSISDVSLQKQILTEIEKKYDFTISRLFLKEKEKGFIILVDPSFENKLFPTKEFPIKLFEEK